MRSYQEIINYWLETGECLHYWIPVPIVYTARIIIDNTIPECPEPTPINCKFCRKHYEQDESNENKVCHG